MTIYYLTYGAIAIQLLVISYLLANKMMARMRYVTEHYPKEKYPKLYPSTENSFETCVHSFTSKNNGVLIFLTSVLVGLFLFEFEVPEVLPAVFLMIQFIPFAYLECSENSYFRAMRKADKRNIRTGSLTPRNLTDFVSKPLLIGAIAMLMLAFAVDYAVNQHIEKYLLGLGKGTFYRTVTLIVTNSFLALIAYNAIYGKKFDPYLTPTDRSLQVSIIVKSMLFISIGLSCFYIVREGTDDSSLDSFQTIFMSIYCLLISLFSIGYRLYSLNVANMNFDVYRADTDSATHQ